MPTTEQIADLAQLRAVAERFEAAIAMIGAAALQCFADLPRFTNDIDLAVALDLESFADFGDALRAEGWFQEEKLEHRWRGPNGSIIDILPAGPRLRAARQIIWPKSEFAMSLVGFDHVFARAIAFNLGDNVILGVAPPPVVALLKIVAYLDDRQGRRKDLDDLRFLFRKYEESSGRIFSDEVFAAELEDISDASAFLLGMDIAGFTADDETAIVQRFLDNLQVPTEELTHLALDDFHQDELRLQQQLRAFSRGFFKYRG